MTVAPSFVALLLAAAALPMAQAAEPPAAPDDAAFAPTQDGTAVLDARAHTLWARCVEGMHWNGKTCAGTPLLLTRAEASARAKARGAAEGVLWRLPRTLELRRLVDKQANPPGVDAKLFPAAPGGLHWSGTATVRQATDRPPWRAGLWIWTTQTRAAMCRAPASCRCDWCAAPTDTQRGRRGAAACPTIAYAFFCPRTRMRPWRADAHRRPPVQPGHA